MPAPDLIKSWNYPLLTGPSHLNPDSEDCTQIYDTDYDKEFKIGMHAENDPNAQPQGEPSAPVYLPQYMS